MRVYGPPFYQALGKHTRAYWLNRQRAYVGGRAWKLWDVLKRSTCKSCLFVGMDFHLSSFSSDSYQQNQDFLLSKQNCRYGQRNPLPIAYHLCANVHVAWLIPQYLYLYSTPVSMTRTSPDIVIQRSLLHRHHGTGSQPCLPGCPLPLNW